GLAGAGRALGMTRAAVLLSYAGYDADRGVLAAEVNALRPAPGQAEVAAWLLERLNGTSHAPRRVQEALSFRVIAPVLGAAMDAQARAESTWQDEANGLSDSPVVLGEDAMRSTANFHAPALALALEGCALANAMVANGAVQRIQRMMNPDLTGLPRYLTPVGGASAGMVPLQKTAAALLGDIRRHAMPVTLDPAPVSDTVEDMGPMTPLAARTLSAQAESLTLLAGAEGLVAAQALDLRAPDHWAMPVAALHGALRAEVDMLTVDRPLGGDIQRAAAVLDRVAPTL
ncbi:MAG: aromatic amino acid lyase, partial [Pseudomonadota bacterium]|nr:aromatic amino acid lyase [Pseudomonadota bacterium]